MATDLGQLEYTLTLNDEGFQEQLDSSTEKVQESGDKMGTSMDETAEKSGGLGGAFSGMAGQFVIGAAVFTAGQKVLSTLKGAISDAISSYQAWTTQQITTTAQLKATHDASGMTVESMSALAEKTQEHTAISREATLAGEDVLLTYTNIGKKVFPDATAAVADLAAKTANGVPTTQDMQAASKALGMALDDPAKNYTKLKRAGVDFTTAQIDQMKTMEASGNIQGAQNILLTAMKGHLADASYLTGTYGGQVALLKDKFNDIVGGAIAKLLDAFKSIGEFLLKHKVLLAAVAGAVTGLAIAIGVALVTALWAVVAPALVAVLAMWPIIVAGLAIGAIAYEIVTHWKDLKKWFDELWKDLKQWFKDGVDWIKQNWEILAAILLLPLAPALLAWRFFHDQITAVVKDVIDWITNNWKLLVEIITGPIGWSIALWHSFHDQIIGFFKDAWDVIKTIWSAVTGFFGTLWNGIKAGISDVINFFVNDFKNAYYNILNMWNGIIGFFSSLWGGIKSTVGQVGAVLSGAFRDAFNAVIGLWDDTMGKIFHGQKISVGPVHFDMPNLNIPKMADGGIVNSATLALIGEAGPEAVVPLNGKNSPMGGNTYNIAQVTLSSKDAVDEFFSIGNRNTQLELGGGSPLANTAGV